MFKVCSFLPSVVSCRGKYSNRLLFRAQFDIVPILGSVYATWRLYYGAIFHKHTPEEVILLAKLPFFCVWLLNLTLGLVPWLSWFSVMARKVCARVQSEEGVQGCLWVSSVFNQVDPVLGDFCKAMSHIL